MNDLKLALRSLRSIPGAEAGRRPIGGMIRVLALVVLPAACTEPLEFADWVTPVPEGVAVHEYGPVPVDDRTGRIDVVEDLVIGERDGDDNYMLYEIGRVQVAGDKIYVHDGGNVRVQVFDENGGYVMTIGREGQGPEELSRFSSIVTVADQLRIHDFSSRRVSVWTLEGKYVGQHPYPEQNPSGHFGFNDGTSLGRIAAREGDEGISAWAAPRYKLVTYDRELGKLAEIHDWPPIHRAIVFRETATNASMRSLNVPTPRTQVAATRDGRIYTALTAEYQIHAITKDGTPLWALRVAWPRVPITEHEIVRALERAREGIPDATRSEINWPAARPALRRIAIDGHGHVYVYPNPIDPPALEPTDPPTEISVDVYSADGARLFSGLIPPLQWSDVRGDFIYTSDTNDETGEERIIRYRLVEPF